jgi:hypothetical protein
VNLYGSYQKSGQKPDFLILIYIYIMIIKEFRLFEGMEPYQNCVIYFLSPKNKKGLRKLYVTISSAMIHKGSTYLAILKNDIYRVYKEDGKFKILKIVPLNDITKEKLGIRNSIYLKDSKTPMHHYSRYHKDIMYSINELSDKISAYGDAENIDFKL